MDSRIPSVPASSAFVGRLPAIALLTLVCGFGSFMTGCGRETPPPPETIRPVQILEIGLTGEKATREFPAVVRATRRVDLSFEVPGRVVELPAVEGQLVAAGQLLARLDTRDLEAARDADRARRAEDRASFERYQELYAVNAVSLQDLEIQQRQFEVSDARLRASQKALDDAWLRAPFAGRIARRYVDLYQNVQAKETVFVLQDETALEATIDLPEANALGLPPGSTIEQLNQRIEAEVAIPADSSRRFPAQISEVATLADPVTRTFAMTFSFEPPTDMGIVPGMTARVLLRRAVTSKLPTPPRFVPVTAVAADEGGDSVVWKIDPASMTVHRSKVEIGTLGDGTVEIKSGLQDGDWIVAAGVSHLREGMQVKRYEPDR